MVICFCYNVYGQLLENELLHVLQLQILTKVYLGAVLRVFIKKIADILYSFQKSMTPKQGTPSSSKRKVNQQPQKSSEKRRSSGRKRSNTYTLPEGTVPSPTVKEMMDSMKEGMSKDELKNSIQEVLNKNSKSSGKDRSFDVWAVKLRLM